MAFGHCYQRYIMIFEYIYFLINSLFCKNFQCLHIYYIVGYPRSNVSVTLHAFINYWNGSAVGIRR